MTKTDAFWRTALLLLAIGAVTAATLFSWHYSKTAQLKKHASQQAEVTLADAGVVQRVAGFAEEKGLN